MYPGDKVIFANGGDRNDTTTPEYKLYSNYPWVQFEFGIGGENKRIQVVGYLMNGKLNELIEHGVTGEYLMISNLGLGRKSKNL